MLITQARGRPLTAIAAAGAVAVAVFEVVQILRGQLYLRVLDHPDGTTLVMVCCLILWGLAALKDRTDLQAVSVTWVVAVSCVFAYEALYKWSFHLAPFARVMPAPELREFVLQSAVAATVLVGFAHHHLSWKRSTWVSSSVLGGLWTFWLLIGFPQLDGQVVFPQVLPWTYAYDQVYLLNRATKLALFLAYLSLFPPVRDRGGGRDPRRQLSPGRSHTGSP